MKFFVISDTHGKIDSAVSIYKSLSDIDAVIHLGDSEKDARALSVLLDTEIISVKGNIDGNNHKEDNVRLLETSCGRLLLTHGHQLNVKSSLTNLLYLAEEQNCTAALFGHTHLPMNETIDGILLLNPGSLSKPAGGMQGSYSLLTVSSDGPKASLHYLQDEKPNLSESATVPQNSPAVSISRKENTPHSSEKTKPKIQGGFLRNILNNSDRL